MIRCAAWRGDGEVVDEEGRGDAVDDMADDVCGTALAHFSAVAALLPGLAASSS